jgi:hypothetical protein
VKELMKARQIEDKAQQDHFIKDFRKQKMREAKAAMMSKKEQPAPGEEGG